MEAVGGGLRQKSLGRRSITRAERNMFMRNRRTRTYMFVVSSAIAMASIARSRMCRAYRGARRVDPCGRASPPGVRVAAFILKDAP